MRVTCIFDSSGAYGHGGVVVVVVCRCLRVCICDGSHSAHPVTYTHMIYQKCVRPQVFHQRGVVAPYCTI